MCTTHIHNMIKKKKTFKIYGIGVFVASLFGRCGTASDECARIVDKWLRISKIIIIFCGDRCYGGYILYFVETLKQ